MSPAGTTLATRGAVSLQSGRKRKDEENQRLGGRGRSTFAGTCCRSSGSHSRFSGSRCGNSGSHSPFGGRRCGNSGRHSPCVGPCCRNSGGHSPFSGPCCRNSGRHSPCVGSRCGNSGSRSPFSGRRCANSGSRSPFSGRRCANSGSRSPVVERRCANSGGRGGRSGVGPTVVSSTRVRVTGNRRRNRCCRPLARPPGRSTARWTLRRCRNPPNTGSADHSRGAGCRRCHCFHKAPR